MLPQLEIGQSRSRVSGKCVSVHLTGYITAALLSGVVGLAGCDAGREEISGGTANDHAHNAPPAEPAVRPVVEMPLPANARFLAVAAPEPGSYLLPPIRDAADGSVLLADGRPSTLHQEFDGKYVILSFIFTNCNDVSGCPLATGVLHQLHREIRKEPELLGRVRLVTLSFDPEHDTPQRMSEYGRIAGDGDSWQFLTTSSPQSLQPILEAYDQYVNKEYDAAGRFTGGFSHILRIYLIDRNKRIRNIYSSSYLYPELLLADLKTLLREENNPTAAEHGSMTRRAAN
jgi:cytochrome c peroxidase